MKRYVWGILVLVTISVIVAIPPICGSRVDQITYADLVLDPSPWFDDTVSVADGLRVVDVRIAEGASAELTLAGMVCPDPSERSAAHYTLDYLQVFCEKPYEILLVFTKDEINAKVHDRVYISGLIKKHDCQLQLDNVRLTSGPAEIAEGGTALLNFSYCPM